MSKTISIHSYRGGTGKSNTSANLAYALAEAGNRVCVVDTDIQSPGIHVLFGLQEARPKTLNDFLWGRIPIEEVAVDISAQLGLGKGCLYLVPSSMNMQEITRVLKEGYDVNRLNQGFREIRDKLGLDYLIIDTHPGLNEETLLSIAISDELLIILRPDQQDFQGTSVTVDIAKRLKVRNLSLVANKVVSHYDPVQIKQKVEKIYQVPVLAVMPLDEKMVELGSGGLMVRSHPESLWSQGVRQIAAKLSVADT